MEKELIITIDEFMNVEKIIDFFKGSEFDAEAVTVEGKSMSGHVIEIPCIKITRKG